MTCIQQSCTPSSSDLVGTYTIKNQVNNFDTLKLFNNNTYSRTLKSKKNSFYFNQSDKWIYEDGRVTLLNYLIDYDSFYDPEANLTDATITSSLPVEKSMGKIKIFYRLSDTDKWYEKIQ